MCRPRVYVAASLDPDPVYPYKGNLAVSTGGYPRAGADDLPNGGGDDFATCCIRESRARTYI